MSIRDRIRAWLGLDEVATLANMQAFEVRQKQRHEAMMGMLNRIEQRMLNEHVGQPRDFAVPVLDWDTVQAINLQQLEKLPEPKEN